jgi:hypothetical protein
MRTSTPRRITATAAALFCAAAGSGCATVRPAAVAALGDRPGGGTSYLAGRATQTVAAPISTVQPAVLAALDDLRMGTIRQTSEAGTLLFETTTADNRRATVSLHPMPAGGTRITARIGLFGDEPLTRALMDRIGIRLGALPPAAIPVDPPSSPDPNPFFSRSAVPDDVMLKDKADAPYRNSDAP